MIATLALLTALGLGSTGLEDSQSTTPPSTLGELLPVPPEEVDPDDFARQVAGLEGAADLLMEAYVAGEISRGEDEEIEIVGPVETALDRAVERLGRSSFTPLVASALEAETNDPGEIDALLRILARVGDASDVREVLALSGALEAPACGLVETLEALLARETSALARLGGEFSRVDIEHRFACVRAVAEASLPESRNWLVGRLGAGDEVDRAVLSALGRRDATLAPLSEVELVVVRGYLQSDDFQFRREAVGACSALADMGAAPLLVDRLADEKEVVREAALAALESITHLRLGEGRERWASWIAQEEAWFRDEAPDLLRRLRDRNVTVVATTLVTLSAHSYRREELTAEVAPLLLDAEPEIRRRAAETLGVLGSPTALPALARALEDPDEETAGNAHRALVRLTGSQAERSSETWLALASD